jgi:hypothetical protein
MTWPTFTIGLIKISFATCFCDASLPIFDRYNIASCSVAARVLGTGFQKTGRAVEKRRWSIRGRQSVSDQTHHSDFTNLVG